MKIELLFAMWGVGGHHLKGAGVEGYVTFLVHFLIPLSAWGRSGVKDPD